MPQLDPASFSSQLFWLTIFFVALYVVLARFFLPRVHHVLEVRAETIEGDVAQAESFKTEAKRVQEIYEKGLADVRAKSKSIISEAQGKMAAAAASKQAELDAVIEKKLSESEAGISTAKKTVMDKLSPVVSDLAAEIVQKLVKHKPDSGDLDKIIKKLGKGTSV